MAKPGPKITRTPDKPALCKECGVMKPPERYTISVAGSLYGKCKDCNNARVMKNRVRKGRANTWNVSARPVGKPATCTKCNQVKQSDDFYRTSAGHTLQSMCIPCCKQYTYTRRERRNTGCDRWSDLIRATLGGKSTMWTHDKNMFSFTIDELREHIESRFCNAMTWDAWDTQHIHLDHIIPKSAFNVDDVNELYDCWSLANLQPLWARDNLNKSSKIDIDTVCPVLMAKYGNRARTWTRYHAS